MTSFSSESEKPRISSSCASGSISTKVSAASSFGSSRNSSGRQAWSRSSKMAAMSAGFMVLRMSRREWYFFSSSSMVRVFCREKLFSAMSCSSYGTSESSVCDCERIFSAHSSVSKTGNPYRIPPFLIPRLDEKSLAHSSCRLNQSFLKLMNRKVKTQRRHIKRRKKNGKPTWRTKAAWARADFGLRMCRYYFLRPLLLPPLQIEYCRCL